MLANEDFIDLIQHLTGSDISLRAIALEDLWQYPSGDKRVWPYVEELLHDTTPCLLGIPFIFGEIRWLAAKALAAEREALGIRKPVRLRNVVRPIDMKEYTTARKAAQVELKPGVEGVLENMAILRNMGCLPLVDLNLYPKVKEPPQEVTYLPPVPVLMPALPA